MLEAAALPYSRLALGDCLGYKANLGITPTQIYPHIWNVFNSNAVVPLAGVGKSQKKDNFSQWLMQSATFTVVRLILKAIVSRKQGRDAPFYRPAVPLGTVTLRPSQSDCRGACYSLP